MHRIPALLLICLSGCAVLRLPYLGLPGQGYSQDELRAELSDYASNATGIITDTADTVSERSSDRLVRKRCLLFKVNVIPLVQDAAFQQNPQEAYVSMLTLIVLLRQYVEDGAGKSALGPDTPMVLDAARQLESDLLEIGAKFLGTKRVQEVHAEVAAYAKRRPIPGREFALESAQRTVADVEETSFFQQVTAVPLVPFRALEGVGDTAAAVRDFNATSREFVRTIEHLPAQMRWQVELLLYDVEERDTTVALLASLESVSRSADRVSEAADRLPEDLRVLFGESDEPLSRVQEIVASARELAGPVRETAGDLRLASDAWATVLGPTPGEPEPPPERPFDIRDWEQTAQAIGTSAGQLEQLVKEIQTLSQSQVLDGALAPVSATVDRADAAARGWVDLAAWRVLQLLVVAFGLALIYRITSAALTRRTNARLG